ncbi:tumor necrosis factor ligand superfamily member 8 isoform X1 [Tupaia chinensis]|uniref:tumor necrosis factor ligand superfamily member 8 isoform X1 n=1 Tax=Tupaia chinensis TaxID=246437 RepID=UPI000FFC3C28|nr:tumor necrosis factor ligand superfamily member 8 isoform X1 [Tupaia chinensis]
MDPELQQALNQVAPSGDTAMHVPADSAARHLGATSRSYLYITTATLGLCLVFTVATIMVLVVQKTQILELITPTHHCSMKRNESFKDSVPNSPGIFHLKGGSCSEDLQCMLKMLPFRKAWAYLQVSKHLSQSKLSWNKDSTAHGVIHEDGNLVIQIPGWYFIICQLQFHVQCSNHSVDLKLEILINEEVKKQALVTVCESGMQTKNIYQNLSPFLLDKLHVNTTVSVKVDKFQYVDTDTFPLENVLSILFYSS